MKSIAVLVLVLAAQVAFSDSSETIQLPNVGFENPVRAADEWRIGEFGHKVGRDFEVKYRGSASLRVGSVEKPKTSGLGTQLPVEIVHEKFLRFTGHIRTKGLDGGASLYVLINKRNGERYYDFMAGRTASGDQEWRQLELLIPNFPDAVRAEVGLLVWGHGSAWFDDLHLESIDTEIGLSDEAAAYLAHALDIMEQHSILRDTVDWPDLRQTASHLASGSVSTGDTYGAIEFAIHSLKDGHSHFYRPSDAEALKGTGTGHAGSEEWESPTGGMLEQNVGYINVPGFSGWNEERMTRFADELQFLIANLDGPDACGWVVDLRNNTGGNVFPMLAGLGPLLGNGEVGGGITVDGNVIPRTYVDGRAGNASISKSPHILRRSDPPVAVLIGERTASSGEATALAFIGLTRTRTFGKPSRGATTGNSPFTLSDGAILNLAITRMIDRAGEVYGEKIQPDVLVESEDGKSALDAAVSWVQGQCE